MGKNTLGTHRILFGLKKRSFFMCKIMVILSGWIVKIWVLNFLSLNIWYISGIRGFEPLFKPVLIGIGVQYFDTMLATVYCFVCYQKVIFSKYWSYEVLRQQRWYTTYMLKLWWNSDSTVIIDMQSSAFVCVCWFLYRVSFNALRLFFPFLNKTQNTTAGF